MSTETPSWTEKTRIPTEGGFFVCMFRILINTKVAFTISLLINPMKFGLWELFINRINSHFIPDSEKYLMNFYMSLIQKKV